MAVTRRGNVIYLTDGYSDRAYDVEIASDIYNPEKYRVRAASESDALEMVLDYRLSKGLYHPFATEEEFYEIFGDDSWEDQCIYVDQGYWISTVAFVIRQADVGKDTWRARSSKPAAGRRGPASKSRKGRTPTRKQPRKTTGTRRR